MLYNDGDKVFLEVNSIKKNEQFSNDTDSFYEVNVKMFSDDYMKPNMFKGINLIVHESVISKLKDDSKKTSREELLNSNIFGGVSCF